MKKFLPHSIIPFLGLILILSSSSTLVSEKKQHTYVGSRACGECHAAESIGNQYEHWLRSPHAKAVLILKTETA